MIRKNYYILTKIIELLKLCKTSQALGIQTSYTIQYKIQFKTGYIPVHFFANIEHISDWQCHPRTSL